MLAGKKVFICCNPAEMNCINFLNQLMYLVAQLVWYLVANNTLFSRSVFQDHHKKRFYYYRSSHPEVFLGKGVLKICSKFTGEHPCRSLISIKLQSNFIEITLWHRCSPSNLFYIFRTSFLKSTSGYVTASVIRRSANLWTWNNG